jgi:hypothetical protein
VNLQCVKCADAFECPVFIGYCPDCIEHFANLRNRVHAAQNPRPGMCVDGKFVDEGPATVLNPVTEETVCGLCGSDEIESGYGLGSGQGMGSYNFCGGCNSFLDFSEDRDEE